MKRAVAFVLSLTVIWLQMMASAQTLSAARTFSSEPECGCCAAKESCRCCCVVPAESDTKPLPAIPVNTAVTFDFLALIPKRVAWLLPDGALAPVNSFNTTSTVLAVPLFTRHCALLI